MNLITLHSLPPWWAHWSRDRAGYQRRPMCINLHAQNQNLPLPHTRMCCPHPGMEWRQSDVTSRCEAEMSLDIRKKCVHTWLGNKNTFHPQNTKQRWKVPREKYQQQKQESSPKIHMELQKIPNSHSNLGKEKQSWRYHTTWHQISNYKAIVIKTA